MTEVNVNLEIEIKLLIDDDTIPAFKAHPMLQHPVQPVKQQRLLSTYFDTTDQQLQAKGYALRIRQQEGQFIQTLKGPAEEHHGIKGRREWDAMLTEHLIRPELIPIKTLQSLFAQPQFAASFTEQFITDFMRTTWEIELSDKTLIEVALDQGEIIAGKHTTPLQEIELELKRGQPETLKALAALFCTELQLSEEKRSKASRGFSLRKKLSFS